MVKSASWISRISGPRELYRHGPSRVAASGRTLEHADGQPFFWLGDTWWMALTPRLDWPHGFAQLVQDRVDKGFNLIQLIVGPYGDYNGR